MSHATPTPPVTARIARGFLHLPRLARILLTALFAVCVTLVLSPLVDYIYLSFFFHPASVIAPSFISTALGFIIYILGWRLTIGIDAADLPPARLITAYVFVGVFAVMAVVLLLLIGVATGIAPD